MRRSDEPITSSSFSAFSGKQRVPRGVLLIALLTLGVYAPRPAHADLGFYAGLGLGVGKFSGSQLIMDKESGVPGDVPHTGEGCCAKLGPAVDLRIGFSLFHIIAPEFALLGNGWDIGANMGGGGFIGGGIRFFPIGVLKALGLADSDFPIDINLGASYGYGIVGKDFAYTGTYVGFDFVVAYSVSDVFDIGVRLDLFTPKYKDFVYSDYSGERGRCLDSSGQQINPDQPAVSRSDATCSGSGPSSSYFAPQLVATFHFPLFD